MCTSISYRPGEHYFGRNLDAEFSFREQVVITPRNYRFARRSGGEFYTRYALIGMASVLEDYPLYYEAANEAGLAMAGLNFPKNAHYQEPVEGKENLALFEFIPWLLGQASTVREARTLLEKVNLVGWPFSAQIPCAPLHYMISDRTESLVVEPVADGLKLYDNPYDVMTNEPTFDFHCWNLQQYMHLSPKNQENHFTSRYPLESYAVGMGAVGLPGDVSSVSRFVRAAFNLANSESDNTEEGNVSQFFHVLDSVSMVRGATLTDKEERDITFYQSCINTDRGIYYYKTYDNNQITAIDLHRADLDGTALIVYPLRKAQSIFREN